MKEISEYGKGATSEKLTSLFLEFYKIVRKNPYTESNPLALCIYIQNFDKDKMSDLITNIIRHLLFEFTVEQCALWNINLSEEASLIGYFWACDERSWKALQGNTLIVDNKKLLLVPKEIVRQRYVFNVECYIKQYILKTMQKYHADHNTDMCSMKEYADGRRVVVPPTRDELYKQQVHGTVHKNYAFTNSYQNKTGEQNFINDILNRIQNGYGSLSDMQLDEIVYHLQKRKAC